MQITINPPTFMFFTPDSVVHLTDENPGPIDINFEDLSKENQRLIVLGVKNKQITCSISELNLLDLLNDKIPSHTQLAHNTDDGNAVLLSEEDLKILAAKLLNKLPVTIKKNTEASNDIRLLRIMLELEKETRNRKTIVLCIEDKLNTLSMSVLNDINNKAFGPAKMPGFVELDSLAESMTIADSELEERIIELPQET